MLFSCFFQASGIKHSQENMYLIAEGELSVHVLQFPHKEIKESSCT